MKMIEMMMKMRATVVKTVRKMIATPFVQSLELKSVQSIHYMTMKMTLRSAAVI